MFLGRGGVYMREGVCRIMAAMARASLLLPQKTILRLQDSFDECLKNPLQDIQDAAVSSFHHFSHHYYRESTPELQTRVVTKYVDLMPATCDYPV